MANNFFLNQDPLLYQPNYNNRYVDNDGDLQKQFNDTLAQYKLWQQQQNKDNISQSSYDHIGGLDKEIKELSNDVTEELSRNDEYQALNKQLTDIIQKELISNVKWRINTNNTAIQNINKQLEIISNIKKNVDNEQRKNMSELNDYVKNYSNITFDEYKKIKNQDTNNKKGTKIQTES